MKAENVSEFDFDKAQEDISFLGDRTIRKMANEILAEARRLNAKCRRQEEHIEDLEYNLRHRELHMETLAALLEKKMTSQLEDATDKPEPKVTTQIHECNCENDRWDIHYGKGLRPHTSGRAVNKGTIVCMNCLREKFPNKD